MDRTNTSAANYRAIRRILGGLDWSVYSAGWDAVMQTLFYNLVNVADPDACRTHAGYVRAAQDGLLAQAQTVRDIFQPIKERYAREPVFEDAYQLATYITLSNGHLWEYNPGIARYFRGQRRNWPVVPSLLRDCKDVACVAVAVERLTRCVRALQRDRAISDEQAVAIAQHYSTRENGLRTWLLDVTRDPLVALFFASLGGQAGDRGLLWLIAEGEWSRLAGGGSNLLGAIRAIEVSGIHRLWAQKGLFIDTSHPELFDQYVPHSLEFEQVDGLVFEDDQLGVPVTQEFLLQDDGALEKLITDSVGVGADPPLECPHPLTPLRTLNGSDYMEIVASWADHHPGWGITEDNRALLSALCQYHAALQQLAGRVAGDPALTYDLLPLRSLQSLWRGAHRVFEPGPGAPDLLEDNYLGRTGNQQLRALLQVMADKILAET